MPTAPLNARTESILRRLVRRDAGPALRKVLSKARPEDIAAAMEHLTWEERRRLYRVIPDQEVAAEVLSSLSEDSIREVTREMTEGQVVALLDYLEPDDATDIVEVLSDDLRVRVIAELQGGDEGADLSSLLAYASDSAGGIMSPVVFKMPETATCGEAIAALQERHDELESAYYVYVVDAQDRLTGVVSLRSLLIHPPGTPLVSIMTRDVISVGPREDQEEVARFVARYDLLAVPVVDSDHHLLGVVTVDDVVDVIREEAAEDMMLMAGVNEQYEMGSRSPFKLARYRGGWLIATAFGGLVAAQITGAYTEAIPVAILAGFIPVVMGMGGNVGLQSTTIAVRGLATGHVQIGGALPFVFRELQVGLILGTIYGLGIGGYALFMRWPDPMVGLSVGVSIVLAVSLASILGAGLPIIMSRMGIDPAVATGPFVTTAVDILGILLYFNVARLFIGL